MGGYEACGTTLRLSNCIDEPGSDCDLKDMSTFHSSLWRNKHGDPRLFSQVFANNSLIKNIFEEELDFRDTAPLIL